MHIFPVIAVNESDNQTVASKYGRMLDFVLNLYNCALLVVVLNLLDYKNNFMKQINQKSWI